MTLVSRNIRFM